MTCRLEAYEFFASQIPLLETTSGLMNAAVALSMHAFEDVDPQHVDDRLQALADRVLSRVSGTNVHAVLAHLHQVLFDEEGFAGNSYNYSLPLNNYLPAVLESRRGIPVTVSLVYKLVAERVGVSVEGVNAPGHFLARVLIGERGMIVDPYFRGKVLNELEAFRRMEQALRQPVPRVPELLQAASHAAWISRIIGNLQKVYKDRHRFDDLEAMNELQSLLQRQRHSSSQAS